MNPGPVSFDQVFARLAAAGERDETVWLGGINVRMVRVVGGGEGHWNSHATTAETVIVRSGDFTVEFRDCALTLVAGDCCVIPAGAEHRGLSCEGAEIVLLQQTS